MSNMTEAEVLEESKYHYFVTQSTCIVFIVFFSISTMLHIAQSFWHRLRWPLWTVVICGIGETIGWAGRLWSSYSPTLDDPFMMQITTTIISPTFLVAAMFITLGRVIFLVGPEYSRLSPSLYTWIFVSADLVALIIQAIGGAMASIADTPDGSAQGARVMLAGIGIQFAAICIYALFAAEFLFRAITNKPLRERIGLRHDSMDAGVKQMIIGLCIVTLFIFVRTVYRTIELTDGWHGSVIRNQALFNWLDGMPITVAMYALNIFHPGRLVYNADRVVSDPEKHLGDTGTPDSQVPLQKSTSASVLYPAATH